MRRSTIYCLALAIAFVALALLKFRGRMEADETAAGLRYVLSLPVIRMSAVIGEIAIAVVLCTRWRAVGGVMGATWVAALVGLYVAMLALGVPTESCGCLGPATLPQHGHALILAGLAAIAWIVVQATARESSTLP